MRGSIRTLCVCGFACSILDDPENVQPDFQLGSSFHEMLSLVFIAVSIALVFIEIIFLLTHIEL